MGNRMNFERGKDPKRALQVGIFVKRSFKDDFSAGKFILSHLESIVNGNKKLGLSIGQKVEEYIMNYITVDDGFNPVWDGKFPDPSLLWIVRSEIDKIDYKKWDSKIF
jgi:hypothetical protein